MNQDEENAVKDVFDKGSKLPVTESATGEFIDLTTASGRDCPFCYKTNKPYHEGMTRKTELFKCSTCGNSPSEETIDQIWKEIRTQEAKGIVYRK